MLGKEFLFHSMCQVRNGIFLKRRVSEICVNEFVLTKNLVYSEKMPSEGLELVLINDVSQPNFFCIISLIIPILKRFFKIFAFE